MACKMASWTRLIMSPIATNMDQTVKACWKIPKQILETIHRQCSHARIPAHARQLTPLSICGECLWSLAQIWSKKTVQDNKGKKQALHRGDTTGDPFLTWHLRGQGGGGCDGDNCGICGDHGCGLVADGCCDGFHTAQEVILHMYTDRLTTLNSVNHVAQTMRKHHSTH